MDSTKKPQLSGANAKPETVQTPAVSNGAKAFVMTLAGNGFRDVWQLEKVNGQWVEKRLVEKTLPYEARIAVQQNTIRHELGLLEGK